MGLTSAIERRASLENPSTSLANPAAWLYDALGARTRAGTRVNEQSSLSISAVWAAVRLLANAVAMTPLVTYRRLPRGKERAREHPNYRLLHDRPNPEMTAFTFKQTLQAHAVTWGGGYAEIEYNGAGRPIHLWPLLPDRTQAVRRDGQKVYVTRVDNVDVVLSPERVLHIPGLSFDGVLGYNLISVARESLGLSKAAEEFGSAFFGSGSRLSGILSTDKTLNDKQKKNIKESWDRFNSGLSNAMRTALLEDGLKWQQLAVSPEEGQYLETRRFQVNEVARWLGVPPHLIGDLERSTNNNIEQQSLEFLLYALGPWLKQWEETISHDLFTEDEQETFFVEFLRDALLQGDSEARSKLYRELFSVGAISPNEIRERENLNAVEGGDIYLVPLNMAPADMLDEILVPAPAARGLLYGPDAPKPPVVEVPPAPVVDLAEYRARRSLDARRRLVPIYENLLLDVGEVVFTKEINAGTRALDRAFRNRGVEDFGAWIDDFYQSHPEYITARSRRVIQALAESIFGEIADEVGSEQTFNPAVTEFVDAYSKGVGEREAEKSVAQLRQILRDTPPEEAEGALRTRFQEWKEKRAAKFARRNAVRASNALARETYQAVGVERIKWQTVGGNCPLCNLIDGKTISITEAFLRVGDTLDPEDGETAPLVVKQLHRHPPIHDGCNCTITAA